LLEFIKERIIVENLIHLDLLRIFRAF